VRLHPASRVLAVTGAALMPVSLFLHWYAVAEGATGDNARFVLKGWDVFESTDSLMVVAAVGALALAFAAPIWAARALMLVGLVTTGFIVVQLVDGPAVIGFLDRSDVSLEVGAWLGLLGALLIVAAGIVSSARRKPAPGS
jgi:hypothetical protein